MQQTLRTVNPATGEPLETYETHGADEVARRLARAWSAFEGWREAPVGERADALRAAARLLDERRDDLAALMTAEMGKPVTQAADEVEKCAWVCRHYADHTAGYLAREDIDVGVTASYVRFDPLGPVLAIMPWNFPLWQVFRFAAPALVAGNSGLLKHSENVTGCALEIERLLSDAGLPEGTFQALLVDHETAADVMGDRRIRGVTLTGSVRAGRAVAATAASHLKKTVLELGGSDPFIVLGDADVGRAAQIAARARLVNSGQSCIAAKRFIVEEKVADEFTEALRGRLEEAVVGDPTDPDTTVGPLAREDLRDDLHKQVLASVNQGAECLTGGDRPDRPGYFYLPTLLTNVGPETTAGGEETFGPVAAVLRVGTADEAVALANASDFGLGASVWSEDLDRAQELAGRIDSGQVFINDFVRSDPRLPFGGVKDSGYGRELGRFGIQEWTNIKTVWVA